MQARYKTAKFIGGALLATVLASIVALGPSYGVYHAFAPITFWQRLISVVVSCALLVPFGFIGFFLWVWIASKFE